jgi:hypothetical protein
MVRTDVNVALGDSFYGSIISCPEKMEFLKGMTFNCQYINSRLVMGGNYSISTSPVESLIQTGSIVRFITKSGSTYALQIM